MAAAPDKVKILLKSWSVHLDGVTHYAGEVFEVAKETAEHLFKVHANGGGNHGAVPAPEEPPAEKK